MKARDSVVIEAGVRWHVVGTEGDVPEGGMAARDVGSHQIAIYNSAGQLYCTDNVCSHAYALLTDGWLDENVIECPLHGAQFDIRTGEALCDPATCNIKAYQVRLVEGRIEVSLPCLPGAGPTSNDAA